MTRGLLVLALTLGFVSSSAILASSAVAAVAAERCVGKRAGCFANLQSALHAAQDGDTIRLAAGTFAGGATVTKSVTLVGAGRDATVLKGGGPVLTVGTMFGETPPTVSIRELTITGGRTTSSPQSVEFTGRDGVIAAGGGIQIPPGHDFTPGATVTIARAAITGNRVAPTATTGPTPEQEEFWPVCPGGPCPYGGAYGGGIDNWGTLTITESVVSGNRIGTASGLSTVASDAEAAGIRSLIGPLTIVRSRIENNHATATAPNGRFADAGGVFAFDAPFTMRDSTITGNSAQLAAGLPGDIEMLGVAGGVHLASNVPSGVIARSLIADNSVGMTNTAGDATTFSGGLHVDTPVDFEISDSVIARNRVSAAKLGSSPGFAHGDGGGGQLFGRMEGTRIFGNAVTASAVAGDAEAMAGGTWVLFGDVSGSAVVGNRLHAASSTAEARALGGGAVVDADPEHPDPGGLSLTGSSVSANLGTAAGRTTVGQGGGIYDGARPFGPFGGPLALVDSRVTHNVLLGRPDATLQGGGVFLSGATLTRSGSVIAGNVPDQCFGCDATLEAARASRSAALDSRDASAHSQRWLERLR